MEAENTVLTTFADGMRLVTRHVPDYPVTKARISIDAGSRDETFGNHKSGVAHGVEHGVFEGSKNYPEAGQVSRTIESVGGSIEAATDFDVIVFDISVSKQNLPTALRAGGDMIGQPLFPLLPIWGEERRIQNEWLETRMDPEKKQYLNTIRVSSGGAASLNPILGDRASIASITPDDLKRFHNEKFRMGNLVVAVEGDLSQFNIADLVRNIIDLPPGKRPACPAPDYVGGDKRYSEKLEGSRITLAFSIPASADSRTSAIFDLLIKLMGGNGSESLYKKISEEQGLNYKVIVQQRPITDYGLLTIDFVCFAENVRPNIEGIAAQIKKLMGSVGPEALENQLRADRTKLDIKLREQTIGPRKMANDVAMYGHVLPRDHLYEIQKTITTDELSGAARSLFEKRPTFVVSGDTRRIPSPNEFIKIFREAGIEVDQGLQNVQNEKTYPSWGRPIWSNIKALIPQVFSAVR